MDQYQILSNQIINDLLSKARDENGWNQITEKSNVKVIQKNYPDSCISVNKGECIFNLPLDIIKEFLMNFENNKLWDPLFQSGENHVLKNEFNQSIHLSYYKTISYLTIWPRDFFVLKTSSLLNDGSVVIAAKSIKDSIHFKHDQSCVQGDVLLSGFLLTPIDMFTTKVTYVLQVNPCGWIPSNIVNDAIKNHPLALLKIRKILTEKTI
jgi:hypothetical protein